MLILAADTSLPILSVALLRDGALLGGIALQGKGSRNEKVLPAIDWLFRESRVTAGDVDLFAVTRGPGSFTGVRIGLATVQGLALAMGKPVCAMTTHEAALWASDTLADSTVVVDDAGRGEYYVTQYAGRELSAAPRLARHEERTALAEGATEIFLPTFSETHNIALGCARRAASVPAAELEAWSDITPVYVRLAEAEVKLQQANRGDDAP